MDTDDLKPFSEKEIQKHVEKICKNADFKTKDKLCHFLRFIVKETLEGRGDQLKGYNIGLEVFGRDADFDSIENSLVRIHAGRLRRLLKIYYYEEGQSDSIQIDIPKGSYKPQFIKKRPGENKEITETVVSKNKDDEPIDSTVIVVPFVNQTGQPEKDYMAHGIAEEISIELTKYNLLKVIGCLFRPTEGLSDYSSFGAGFIIDGSIYLHDQQIILFVKLIDSRTNHQIWGERYKADLSIRSFIEIEENIAGEVANRIGSETGILLKDLSQKFQRIKPQNFDVLNATLSYFYFEAHQSGELMLQTFRILSEVSEKYPDSGITNAFLGNLYGNIYALDYPNNEGALEKVIELAEKAIRQDPNNQIVRMSYAYKCFLNNEKDEFFLEAEKCLSMNSHSPIRPGIIGFHLSLYGDWERGKHLLDTVMNSKTGYFLYFHGATCAYYYRKNDYKKALEEANKYNLPNLFWSYMLRAACLAQLHRIEEARNEIDRLKSLRPDFEDKAYYLISRFIKENSLVEHLIEGLRLAGMSIPPPVQSPGKTHS